MGAGCIAATKRNQKLINHSIKQPKMKYIIVILGLLIFSCNTTKKEKVKFTYPPEWEPHEAIWTDFNYERYNSTPDEETRLALIANLSRYVKTKVVFDNDS